jgi:hypothetical protein
MTDTRALAIKVAGVLNTDPVLEAAKIEAITWLKKPGDERVYVHHVTRKGKTEVGCYYTARHVFKPAMFAGKSLERRPEILDKITSIIAAL